MTKVKLTSKKNPKKEGATPYVKKEVRQRNLREKRTQ